MEINSGSVSGKGNITVLDIGSSKLKCIHFGFDQSNGITALAKNTEISSGIKGGSLLNVAKAKNAINSIIESTEKHCEENINEVFVNFADCGAQSKILKAKIEINNRKITENDILILKKQIYSKLELPAIHVIPIEYHIDSVQEVSNPIGMYGKTLSASFNVITVFKTLLLNLENCLSQCNLKLKGCSISSYTSALSCLTHDEMENSSAVIDIGGNYTSIGIFYQNGFINSLSIPIGGVHITKDLSCGLGISFDIAEQIKKANCNHLLDENLNEKASVTYIDDVDLNKKISIQDLKDIAKPRIEEILEIAAEKITQCKANLTQIVLTGGVSKISNIEKTAQSILNMKTKIKENHQIGGQNYSAEYSATIGTINLLQEYKKEYNANKSSKGYFNRILKALNLAN